MEPWQGPEPRRPPSARVPAGIEEYFPLDTVCDTVPANVEGRGGRAVPVAGVGETGRSRSASFMIYHLTPARHTGDPSSSHIRVASRQPQRNATQHQLAQQPTRIRAGLMTSSALSRSAYCVLNCLKARVSASSCALVTSTSPWHHADNGLNNAGV